MSVVDGLRDANRRLSSDDDRWWAQLLAVVLALGLTLRSAIHVLTALILNEWTDLGWIDGPRIDVALAGTDVAFASPCEGLRGHRYDLVARYLTFVTGLGVWYLYTPLAGRPLVGKLYVAGTIMVCLADPVAFAIERIRS